MILVIPTLKNLFWKSLAETRKWLIIVFVFTLDFIRYGIPDMQRFISRSLLQSRSISRPLGSLSFLISTFWWLRSPLVFGMSSRTSTTNVFSVSRSSNIYKFWNGKFVNNFSKIEVMDCIIHFERIFQLFWFFLQLCYMPVVLSILPVLWFVWCWHWPQSFVFWVQSLSLVCSSSI